MEPAPGVYRVEFDDEELEADADLPRGPFVSFQLTQARVAEIVDRDVDPTNPATSRHYLGLSP